MFVHFPIVRDRMAKDMTEEVFINDFAQQVMFALLKVLTQDVSVPSVVKNLIVHRFLVALDSLDEEDMRRAYRLLTSGNGSYSPDDMFGPRDESVDMAIAFTRDSVEPIYRRTKDALRRRRYDT